MKILLTGLMLLTSISAIAEEAEAFKVVMKYKTVMSRYYPNDRYNTESIQTQCQKMKGELLKSTERVSESYGVTATVGICKYPEIVASNTEEVTEETSKKYIYQAVASLRFPNGNGTEGIRSKCESRGGELMDTKSGGTGRAFATLVSGGVCRIAIED